MKTIFCLTKKQHQHFLQILALKFLGLDHQHLEMIRQMIRRFEHQNSL